MRCNAFRWLLVPALLLSGGLASADSWAPPSEEQYVSQDGLTRVTITPRPLGGALPYFQDKVAGKEPAGQRAGSEQTHPVALLEHQSAGGHWQAVWTKDLVNDVGPVSALVANNGALATFDNWHSTGLGPDVVVIYDAQGNLVRKLALRDFLPAGYIAALPRSVSSLWWGAHHALADDGQTLVLHVIEPGADLGDEERGQVDVRIRMADGEVLPHEGNDWTKAMATVAKLEAERQARWNALRALRATPLRAPNGAKAAVWREYMVELRERLSDASGHDYGGWVLPTEGDGDYPDDPDGIMYALDEYADDPEFSTGYFVFVSPSSDALAKLLAKHLGSMTPGSMKGAHISFVGTPADAARVEAAAAQSGAEISLIDRSTAYPGMGLPEAMPEWFR